TAREFAWLFYSHPVRPPESMPHAVDKNLSIALAMGLQIHNPRFPLPHLEADAERARGRLRAVRESVDRNEYVALVPGARWPSKRWNPARFGELAKAISAEFGLPSVLLGSKDDREIAAEIVARGGEAVIDLVGQTDLRELACLIADAAMVVTCD